VFASVRRWDPPHRQMDVKPDVLRRVEDSVSGMEARILDI
jgi:hypothetical protein